MPVRSAENVLTTQMSDKIKQIMSKHPCSEGITGADAYYKNMHQAFISGTVKLHNKTTEVTAQSALLNMTMFSLNVFVSCNFVSSHYHLFFFLSFFSLCGCWPTSFKSQ